MVLFVTYIGTKKGEFAYFILFEDKIFTKIFMSNFKFHFGLLVDSAFGRSLKTEAVKKNKKGLQIRKHARIILYNNA